MKRTRRAGRGNTHTRGLGPRRVAGVLFVLFLLSTGCQSLTGATSTLSPLPAPESARQADGPAEFPAVAVRLALGKAGDGGLGDLSLDPQRNRLYVSQGSSRLFVLDDRDFALVHTLPVGGDLVLDATLDRLYVAPGARYLPPDESPVVSVIDLATLEIVAALPGRSIALDPAHNRLFVGEPLTAYEAANGQDVRIYAADTLARLGAIRQPGTPIYNPVRNELLIVAYTLYTADPDRRLVTGDLFPELSDGLELRWCNGCPWVDRVKIFPEHGLILVDLQHHCAGKGCGMVDPPRLLDATTLSPVERDNGPVLQADCGAGGELLYPVEGRLVTSRIFSRYVSYSNLLVQSTAYCDGDPAKCAPREEAWRDGLRSVYVDPVSGNVLLWDGQVLDPAGLQPLGRLAGWTGTCFFARDAARGRLYGAMGNELWGLDLRGGRPAAAPPAAAVARLPAQPVETIRVSPDFVQDRTLLVVSGSNHILRSTDGGESWVQLHGGLPEGDLLTLDVHFSPAYAVDDTLFASGYRADFWGEGVLRSQDQGESWEPLWNNLTHLRIHDLTISPGFADDRTVVAQALWQRLDQGQGGAALHRSIDGGASWQEVATATYPEELPHPSRFITGMSPPLVHPVRRYAGADGARDVEVLLDGKATPRAWARAHLPLDAQDWIVQILPGPQWPDDATFYVITYSQVWRTPDNGASWQQLQDPRFNRRDAADALSAAAVSPSLDGGSHLLFLGTNAGELLTVDSGTAVWQLPPMDAPRR